jgi:hypothetical protein
MSPGIASLSDVSLQTSLPEDNRCQSDSDACCGAVDRVTRSERGAGRSERMWPVAKFVFGGTYASDDPTRAVLPLLGARAAVEGGHEAEVFLMGEAVYLMKNEVADACIPVGWPNLGDVLRDVIRANVPIYI